MIFRGEIMNEVIYKENQVLWGGPIPTEEPKRQEKLDKINETWPKVCDNFMKYMGDDWDKKFIAGDEMTTYDFVVGVTLIDVFENVHKSDQDREFLATLK
jgi:hypothetical protein